MLNKGIPVVGYVGEGGRVFIPDEIGKKSTREANDEKKVVTALSWDEHHEITSAVFKLKALLNITDCAVMSELEASPDSLAYMLTYMMEEVEKISAVINQEPVGVK